MLEAHQFKTTQCAVKDLRDWPTYKPQEGFRTRRFRHTSKRRREVLSDRMREISTSSSMIGMCQRSHGRTANAPQDERGGNGYVRPTATAPRLDSNTLCEDPRRGDFRSPDLRKPDACSLPPTTLCADQAAAFRPSLTATARGVTLGWGRLGDEKRPCRVEQKTLSLRTPENPQGQLETRVRLRRNPDNNSCLQNVRFLLPGNDD
jgi:hypothetical protein